jgi:hypothetical protein
VPVDSDCVAVRAQVRELLAQAVVDIDRGCATEQVGLYVQAAHASLRVWRQTTSGYFDPGNAGLAGAGPVDVPVDRPPESQ